MGGTPDNEPTAARFDAAAERFREAVARAEGECRRVAHPDRPLRATRPAAAAAPASPSARRDLKAFRRLGRGLAVFGLAAVLLGFVPHTSVANAAESTDTGDPRATIIGGNVTTCADVGLPNDKQLGKDAADNGSADGITVTGQANKQYIDVTIDPSATIVIDKIVVKGGDGANAYPGNVLDNLHAPLNGGGQLPTISHWFLCYHEGEQGSTTTTSTSTSTTSTSTTTTSTSTTTSTTSSTVPETQPHLVTTTTTTTEPPSSTTSTSIAGSSTEPSTSTPTTPAPAPAEVLGEEVVRSQELPRTGSNMTMPLVALGALLLVLGALASHRATVLLRR